jgi:hypothetical protein
MIEVKLTKEKETKNTIRYAEAGADPVVRTIYLPKPTAEKLGDRIRVTIEPDYPTKESHQ